MRLLLGTINFLTGLYKYIALSNLQQSCNQCLNILSRKVENDRESRRASSSNDLLGEYHELH